MLLVPACGREPPGREVQPESERPARGGEFRVTDFPGLRSWDPHEVTDIVSGAPVSQVYEGLVQYSPSDPNSVVPALAERWETSPDGRCYTFHLRPSARFANDPCFSDGSGRRVAAQDIKYSLERVFGGRGRNVLPSAAWEIEGARECEKGTSREIRGVAAPDDSTVVIRLSRPRASFLPCLALNWGYVLPPEADRFYGRDVSIHPVGAGPFRLARWEPGAVIVLVRNENYWERDQWGVSLPYLDRVVLVLSSAQQVPGVGGLHAQRITRQGPEGSQPGEPASHAFQHFQTTRYNTIFFAWNMARETVWTGDRRLRQAVACAFHPQPSALLQAPAKSLLPPGFPGYDPARSGQVFDLERARRLLAEAGYPGGRGLPTLAVSTLSEESPLESTIENALRRIGIRADLRVLPKPEHWASAEAGRLEFFRSGWLADYPDPENFFEIFCSGSGLNRTRFANARYDSLFDQLVAETDVARRMGFCRELEEILLVEAPACFVRHDMDAMLVSPEVRNFGYSVNPFWRKYYKYVWLARD